MAREVGGNDIRRIAVAIGLFFVVVNAYWVGIASELWYSVFTFVNPFSNAIFTLTVLIVLSFLLGKFSGKLVLDSCGASDHIRDGLNGFDHLRVCDDGKPAWGPGPSVLVRDSRE